MISRGFHRKKSEKSATWDLVNVPELGAEIGIRLFGTGYFRGAEESLFLTAF